MSEYDFGPEPRSDKNRDDYAPPVPSQSRAPSSQSGMGQMGFEDFNSDFASFDPYEPYGDAFWEELENQEPPLMTQEELERLKSDPEAVAQRVAELDLANAREWQQESVKAGANPEELEEIPGMSMQEIQEKVHQVDGQAGMKSAIVYITLRQGEDFEGIEIMMVPADPTQQPIYKFVDSREVDIPIDPDSPLTAEQIEQMSIDDKVGILGRNFRMTVTNARRPSAYIEHAKRLYEVTIEQIHANLNELGIDHLQLVLDEQFQNLPFAALMNEDGQFLIDEFSLAFSLSAQMTDFQHHDLREAEVTALGESNFDAQKPLAAAPAENAFVNTRTTGNVPLPTAPIPQERRFTRENFQRYLMENAGSAVDEVWKNAAVIDNLMEALNIARLEGRAGIDELLETEYGIQEIIQILHLTTHGEFQPGRTDAQGEFQAGDSNEQYLATRTGKITLREILNMNFEGIEMVVLAACRTGLGDAENEHGIAGGILSQGAESVMGSLWYVSDEGTLAMMTLFHELLEQANVPTAQQMQEVQRAMKDGRLRLEGGYLVYEPEGRWANTLKKQLPPELAVMGDLPLTHPYYWSAFQMHGNGH